MLLGFSLLFLISCAPKIVPIKGNYPDKPFEVISDNNKDIVWDKTIDFFAQNGLSIKIIDRSSGLIISDKTQLKYSRENKKGELLAKDAWVVLDASYDPGNRKLVPLKDVTGEWNIRLKDAGSGKTNINVNLVNIIAYAGIGKDLYVQPLNAKSTGNFEKLIAEKIK